MDLQSNHRILRLMSTNAVLQPVINLSRLARDLAQDIYEPDQIRQTYALTQEQFNTILADPNFARMLREMVVDWNSASGTAERVKVKAATAVEAVLDSFIADVVDKSIPLTQRTDALKALMRLGELGEREALGSAAAGGSVSISINLGNPGQGQPPKTVTIDAEPLPEESPALPG